jgi:5'-nucleotidase / UDP-sugar diphosphatase
VKTKQRNSDNIKLKAGVFGLFIGTLLLSPANFTRAWAAEKNQDFTLTIIHTNDLHAHEEPFLDKGKTIGGMAGVGQVLRNLKKKYPDAVTADAGDMFQGSILYNKFKGDVEVNLFNKMGYDVFTIGNHEFDDGAKNLADQLAKAKFDVINTNIDASAVPSLEKLIKPSVIKKIGNEKVAFVGAVTPDLESLATNMQGVKLKVKGNDWINPVRDEVLKLKSEGIDKIVLLTHCGVKSEKELAERIPEVDAIVGGHSHTRLEKPLIVKHADGSTTSIVQTGCYGRAVGLLQLTFDQNGLVKPQMTAYSLTDITPKTAQAADLKAYIDKMSEPFAAITKQVVSTASDYYEKKNALCDTSMGDIVTDAIVEYGKQYGVTLAFQNRGGIRGVLQKGPITVAQVEQILPFENYIVYATVTGAVVKRVVEHSLADGMGGHFAEVSGLKIIYDQSRPSGSRILTILASDGKGNFKPVEDSATYKMAMNHYNFEGGEKYDFAGATNVVKTKVRMADAMTEYLRKHPNITPAKPNRIVCVKEGVLHVKDSGGDKSLFLSEGPRAARLSIVAGTGPGISTIYSAFPVPLANAQVLKTGLRASGDGSFEWRGIKKLLQTYKSTTGDKKVNASWVTIVAHPDKGSSDHTVITAPVAVQ